MRGKRERPCSRLSRRREEERRACGRPDCHEGSEYQADRACPPRLAASRRGPQGYSASTLAHGGAAMTAIKLGKIPDRTLVKLTIVVPPDLHGWLQDYAVAYAEAYGQQETVTV